MNNTLILNSCEQHIDPKQHGFTNAKSCTTQMIPFTYDLTLTLNNKSKVDVIYFDFAKAFDSVSHDLILKKLKHDAIQKKAMKWINGRRFDHYSDLEYFNKQKELSLKFVLNYLIMYYKIINLLVHIKLPEHFTFVEAEQVRYTRQTSTIIK